MCEVFTCSRLDVDEHVRRSYKFLHVDVLEVDVVACIPKPLDSKVQKNSR